MLIIFMTIRETTLLSLTVMVAQVLSLPTVEFTERALLMFF